jgi:amino-acid N-acetyltransferase
MDAALAAIRRTPDHMAAVRLLEGAGLPASDLTAAHMDHFFYCGPAAAPEGIVGIELCGVDALLRSLVVSSDLRATGRGSALVSRAEGYVRENGARAVYLLTTTAERFFRSRGYVPTPRETAPPAIRVTREFAALCPASSAFLVKRL